MICCLKIKSSEIFQNCFILFCFCRFTVMINSVFIFLFQSLKCKRLINSSRIIISFISRIIFTGNFISNHINITLAAVRYKLFSIYLFTHLRNLNKYMSLFFGDTSTLIWQTGQWEFYFLSEQYILSVICCYLLSQCKANFNLYLIKFESWKNEKW